MSTTRWFIEASVGIWIGFDLSMWRSYGIKGTISYFVWQTSAKYPVVPFAVGVLCGHLFWQVKV